MRAKQVLDKSGATDARAEAYPRKHAGSEADNYAGPLKMYLAA